MSVFRKTSGSSHSPLHHTDARGRFMVEHLEAGRYWVLVDGDGLLSASSGEFELAHGERRDLGRLQLRSGARLEARAMTAEGRPWTGSAPRVYVRTAPNGLQFADRFAAGVLHFPPLPPGTGRVLIDDAELMVWPVAVDLQDGQTTQIELTVHIGTVRRVSFARDEGSMGRTLRLRVTDAAGRELRAVQRNWPADGKPVEESFAVVVGRWSVTAEDDAGLHFAGTLDVRDLGVDDTVVAIPRVQ